MKFELAQTFHPTSSNISFVLAISEPLHNMLGPFERLHPTMLGTDIRSSWFLGVVTLEIDLCLSLLHFDRVLEDDGTEDLGETESLESQSVEYESNTKSKNI